MKTSLFRLLIDAIVYIASIVPVKNNRVVFCSYGGRGIGNDPGKIALELLKRSLPIEIVWMLKDLSVKVPTGIRKCKIYDPSKSIVGQFFTLLKSSAVFSSAKVIVCDSKSNLFKKSARSVYIQTWHGDLPFKLIEGECIDELGKEHERLSSRDSRQTDVILSASSCLSEIFRKYFWLPSSCTIMEIGIPRNDVYYSGSDAEDRCVRMSFNIPDDVQIAIYAPTFRDTGDTSVYGKLDFVKLKKSLVDRFGGCWKIFVRFHPNVNSVDFQMKYDDDVIDTNGFADGEALFKTANVLITDASSVMREFITMKKPIFVYFPDFDEYVNTCRSLRPLFFKLPFTRCATTDELVDVIINFDEASYMRQVDEFLKDNNIRFYDTGKATETVSDYIQSIVTN